MEPVADPHSCEGHIKCEPRQRQERPHDVCYCMPELCPCFCSTCTPQPELFAAKFAAAELSRPDDVVKHPKHYTRGKIEVWDFIIDQQLNYCRGTIVKYLCRAGYKDPAKEVEDLEKAKAYLEREIRRVKDAEAG